MGIGNNNKKKKAVLIVICCILLLIFVIMVAVFLWARNFLGLINRVEGTEETLSSEQIESILNETDEQILESSGTETGDEVETGSSEQSTTENLILQDIPVEVIPISDNVINILLVGQDRRPGQSRQRSDSMILCTINKSTKSLTMTSFLRDTWVYIPNRYYERLNVPYAIGGFKLLNNTLKHNFGVTVDYNVEVDFSGFEEIINLIGGVDINLSAAEAKYFTRYFGKEFLPGVQTLNGEKALVYARIRALDNDLVRSTRQRTVINAVINKCKGLDISQLYGLVKNVLPMVTTNMSDGEILGLLLELVPMLSDLTINSQRIPADGAYQFKSIDGKSVIYLSPNNLEKNIQILKNTIMLSE